MFRTGKIELHKKREEKGQGHYQTSEGVKKAPALRAGAWEPDII
jgi:hypothetical protein